MRFNIVKTGRVAAALAGATLAAAVATTPARADIVGQLQCNIAGGTSSIIVSERTVSCTFQNNAGPAQFYTGSISRLGIDIGQLNSGTLTYQVLALGTPVPGSLQGNYVGAGAGLTIGTGIGVDALVGGGNAVTLQPIATTTTTGTNINAGVGALRLQFAGLAQPPMRRMRRHHRGFHHHHHHAM